MNDQIRIMLGGDTFPTESNAELFSKGAIKKIFGEDLPLLFSEADYSVLDLEGVFTNSDKKKEKAGPSLKAPISALSGYKELGLSCALLANTHFMDYGAEGFHDMTDALSKNGIDWLGAGADGKNIRSHHTITVKGKTITFFTVTENMENAPGPDFPGVSIYEAEWVLPKLSRLKKECDLLIVIYHGGIERLQFPRPVMRQRFHAMAESGADIVVMQHNHVIGAEEYYKGSYLLYGQGNFCFNYTKEATELNRSALLLEIILKDSGFEVKKHPVMRTKTGCALDYDNDLSDFYERSALLKRAESGDPEAEQLFSEEFSKATRRWITPILSVLRGEDPLDEEKKGSMEPAEFEAYLESKYSSEKLLALSMFFENAEFREVSIRIIKDLIERSANSETG